jgi:hypothetical protein
MKKIAQAATLGKLEKYLNDYCFSTTYKISENFEITNCKGVSNSFTVVRNKKGALVLYQE